MEFLYDHIAARQQKQIGEQQKQIEQLTALVQQLVPAQQTIQNTTNQGEVAIQGGDSNEIKVDNSKNQHVTINVFGQERLDHITQDQIRKILTSVKFFSLPDAAVQAVLQAAMLAYSDPDHPENLTCYLPNKKTKDALIHGGTGWEIQPVQLILPPIMQKSIDLLFDKQPSIGLERDELNACGEVLKELASSEKDPRKVRQLTGPNGSLRAVLIRNKEQLARILEGLPVAGQD